MKKLPFIEKGGDLIKEVSYTKCQWYKNVRVEGGKSFLGSLGGGINPEKF